MKVSSAICQEIGWKSQSESQWCTCTLALGPLFANVHTGLATASCSSIFYMRIPLLRQETHFKFLPPLKIRLISTAKYNLETLFCIKIKRYTLLVYTPKPSAPGDKTFNVHCAYSWIFSRCIISTGIVTFLDLLASLETTQKGQ